MSLANEWANGEDSITVPRSRRRSSDRDVDPKDQFHSSSQKKGRRNRYEDADVADMVEAGYINNDRDDNHDGPRQGNSCIDKDGRRKPVHLLIECREFLWLSQALQDKMRAEQSVAGSVAYNAPPPPPNPPENMVQQGHQAAMI
jgi:hypothetical protein